MYHEYDLEVPLLYLIAFDERVIFCASTHQILPCACVFVCCLFVHTLSALTLGKRTRNADNATIAFLQGSGLGTLKHKSHSIVKGNQSID